MHHVSVAGRHLTGWAGTYFAENWKQGFACWDQPQVRRHRNTETSKLHPHRHQLEPWELLVLPGLCNAEAGEMASDWNEPQARVSEHLRGESGLLWPVLQGRVLLINLLVLSLLKFCLSTLPPPWPGSGGECWADSVWTAWVSAGARSSWTWRRYGQGLVQTSLLQDLPGPFSEQAV